LNLLDVCFSDVVTDFVVNCMQWGRLAGTGGRDPDGTRSDFVPQLGSWRPCYIGPWPRASSTIPWRERRPFPVLSSNAVKGWSLNDELYFRFLFVLLRHVFSARI